MTNKCWVASLIIVSVLFTGCQPQSNTKIQGNHSALPRITVVDGQFTNSETGKPFVPRGFHYIRLLPSRTHYVHTPGLYDSQAAEAMFADLEAHDFNIVRVFLGEKGYIDKNGLNEEYMANLFDFLERARRHRIYVILLQMHLPDTCEKYRVTDRSLGYDNVRYFSGEHIEKKCLLLRDLVGAVKQYDPSLLSTVFAWELENESTIHVDQEPFKSGLKKLTAPNGKTYTLDSQAAMQNMLDECTVYWANQCAAAVKTVDPQALVSTSVFTYQAVGRSGPNRITAEESPDPRCPLRPLALAQTHLSYIDIHFYVNSVEMLQRDFVVIEFDELKTACRRSGKPLFVGEVGAIKPLFPQFETAVERIPQILDYLDAAGFAGWCYWTYDCHEQPECWNAKHNNGSLFHLLSSRRGNCVSINRKDNWL